MYTISPPLDMEADCTRATKPQLPSHLWAGVVRHWLRQGRGPHLPTGTSTRFSSVLTLPSPAWSLLLPSLLTSPQCFFSSPNPGRRACAVALLSPWRAWWYSLLRASGCLSLQLWLLLLLGAPMSSSPCQVRSGSLRQWSPVVRCRGASAVCPRAASLSRLFHLFPAFSFS